MKYETEKITIFLKNHLKYNDELNYLIPYILDIPLSNKKIAIDFVKHLISLKDKYMK